MLNSRKLYKVEISKTAPSAEKIKELSSKINASLNLNKESLSYFLFTDSIKNRAYNGEKSNINILMKNNELIDIAKASDLSNLESLDKTVKKYILCYTKDI
jgi:hypothetical protein